MHRAERCPLRRGSGTLPGRAIPHKAEKTEANHRKIQTIPQSFVITIQLRFDRKQ
jgi:hypothetical protein